MRLDREYIQEFIDVIYEENKTIVLTAPTGFGKSNFFCKTYHKGFDEKSEKMFVGDDHESNGGQSPRVFLQVCRWFLS